VAAPAPPAAVGPPTAPGLPLGQPGREFGASGPPTDHPDTPWVTAEAVSDSTSTTRFCSNCEVDVEPGGKGHCPTCGRFLPDNVVALTHGGRRMSLPPERASRRAELRTEVWNDLGGTVPPIMAEVAEDFVSACVLRDQLVEHLEAIGPLTQRGTRRAAMDLYLATSARIERLSAMLSAFRGEARLEAVSGAPPHLRGLDRMPTKALELLQGFLARIAGGETLTDREEGALEILQSAIRGDIVLPGRLDDLGPQQE
jgi:hypothetical protein